MIDLHDVLAASSEAHPLRQRRLYAQLRAAILSGRLLPGAVLPSTRELAREQGMARNTVIHAYEQLAAEGYVQSSRQGTVVAALGALRSGLAQSAPKASGLSAARHQALSQRTRQCSRRRTPEDDLRPFMPGVPALDAFPLSLWRRLCERADRAASPGDLSYRHAVGEPELRQAIATYLRASRGVRCHADQVIVTDGTQHSLSLCAQLLADPGELAWIEHPGYGGARTALSQAGLRLRPITVDEQGIHPPAPWWHQHPPRLIYTTPSHQYPLGSVLSLERRLALIEGARRHGAWILEDDYDSEFRHDGPPLAAMQGLVDDAPVVYLGTFSKSMFPGLRLGFVVMPAVLADQAVAAVGELDRRGHAALQRALAAFIDEGHFTSHLRKMRKLYRVRQQALREALLAHWPVPSQVLGGSCGMHLTLSLPDGLNDQTLAQQAFARGLSPRPLSVYGTGGIAGFNGMVMGYANTPTEAMAAHVRTLASCVPSGCYSAPRSTLESP